MKKAKHKASLTVVILCCLIGIIATSNFIYAEDENRADKIVLADFSKYPEGWKAKGGFPKANNIYQIVSNDKGRYLSANVQDQPVRIFKKISWNSKTYPVIEWKWRVKKWPENKDARVFFYISLDTDMVGIPTIVKYVWSRHLEKGSVEKRGFFSPTEVVVQTDSTDSDDWIIQKVNARADFKKFLERDPKDEAYGIGILVDSGIEVDFEKVIALKE